MTIFRRLVPGEFPTAYEWNLLCEIVESQSLIMADASSGVELVRTGGGPPCIRLIGTTQSTTTGSTTTHSTTTSTTSTSTTTTSTTTTGSPTTTTTTSTGSTTTSTTTTSTSNTTSTTTTTSISIIYTPCCGALYGTPSTLYVTFTASVCSCLNGLTVPIFYTVNPTFLGIPNHSGWVGTMSTNSLCVRGNYVHVLFYCLNNDWYFSIYCDDFPNTNHTSSFSQTINLTALGALISCSTFSVTYRNDQGIFSPSCCAPSSGSQILMITS